MPVKTAKPAEPSVRCALYVGSPSAESTVAAVDAVLQILNAPHADEKTKRLALRTLANTARAPEHVHMHDMVFSGIN